MRSVRSQEGGGECPIRSLPGRGGHVPADGFKPGGVPSPVELPGIAIAALATLSLGAVLGPEAPLIALGAGLAAAAVRLARREVPAEATAVVGAAGSFAAISMLLGSPLLGAFLLMEASGLGGATWPSSAALAIGLVAAVAGTTIRRLALLLRPHVERRLVLLTPLAGLVVGALAMTYANLSGHGFSEVLFSGQDALGPLISQSAGYSGAAGGIALSHLPGLPLVAGVAMGIGAMSVVMLRLPLTSVLLVTLLLGADGLAVMPLVIVAVAVAYVASARLTPAPVPATPATATPAEAPVQAPRTPTR
jgi:MFS family permease